MPSSSHYPQKSPQLVASLGKVVQVCCGRDFTVALDAQGKVWAWGQNDAGQVSCVTSVSNLKLVGTAWQRLHPVSPTLAFHWRKYGGFGDINIGYVCYRDEQCNMEATSSASHDMAHCVARGIM